MSLDIGLGTFSGQRPADGSRSVSDTYSDITSLARLAESVGFDSLWVSSHHALENEHISSPLILLAGIATLTTRLRLGTAMVLAPFQEPIRFAEDCATLDQLSGGRLTVGLGLGWRAEEFAEFGIPVRDRVGRIERLATFCRQGWDQPEALLDGRTVRIRPRPRHRIPLALGGTAPAALRRAGRLADLFLATGTPQSGLPGFRDQLAVVDRSAAAAGREPGSMTVGFQANCWVSEDGALPAVVARGMWSQIGASLAAHRGVTDRPAFDEAAVRERGFFGTPDELVTAMTPWVQAIGPRAAQLVLRMHFPGMTAAETGPGIRLFADAVAPRLRDLAR